MKTLITALEENIESEMDKRFGRAHWFCVHDDQAHTTNFYQNPYIDAQGGAGTKTAEFVIELGVNKIISGHFGPKAKDLLEKIDIQLVEIDETVTVSQLIERLNTNN